MHNLACLLLDKASKQIMYQFLKRNIKSIIPEKFLFKNELFFRRGYAFFFKGTIHECNVCNKKLRTFINLKNHDLLCPNCGSLSRNRRLWDILKKKNAIKGNVLHFSPSRNLFRNFKNNKNINYFSTDFENEFLADYQFDITKINQPDNTFDLIICYHVLEHIKDDTKAMLEIFRVLKPNGVAYIQTPFKDGDIYEDYTITTPDGREKHFGQNDHYRIYSVKGLDSRLKDSGFKTTIINFNKSKDDIFNGFLNPETVIELIKQTN